MIQTTNTREMTGAIFWTSGLGYRECTAQYAEAYEARQAARDALDACSDTDPAYMDLYYAAETAHVVLAILQAEGGHLGVVVRLEKADPLIAQMGGGRIRTSAPRELIAA